jgi:transposase-like protein
MSTFSGRCFPDDVIAPAVRWSSRFGVGCADVTTWLAERDFVVDRKPIFP